MVSLSKRFIQEEKCEEDGRVEEQEPEQPFALEYFEVDFHDKSLGCSDICVCSRLFMNKSG